MPRRPLTETIALSLRVPRGHDGFWSIIMDLGSRPGSTFSQADIDGRTNVDRATVSDYVRRLVRSGHLMVVSTETVGVVRSHRYRLARPSRTTPRVRRDGTECPEPALDRMWRAMKMLDRWTWIDLVEATTTETLPPVADATAKTYARRLHAAGVLQVIVPGGPNRPAVYRLLRNVGAAAPRILRAHIVFDPNSNTVLGTPEAEEVA